MTLKQLTTIEQLEQFLDGSQACVYEIADDKKSTYRWIEQTLKHFGYPRLGKQDKGVVRRFLIKISGYSRQQITRLIQQYSETRKIILRSATPTGFSRRYTDEDIILLAELDELHETPCGAMLRKFCERAYQQGDSRYERLSRISISHIYNLRSSRSYQQQRRHFSKTQSKKSSIGERRKPTPNGHPGYLRVDTVHQGDQDKQKGVYHINLVDEVTQFEICFAAEKISERFLIAGLEQALNYLPFEIRGFHSDNGSEYINNNVSRLLEKLRIEFTKSRARQSNDNALVESKNGSIIRKHFGYSYIPQHYASMINQTVQEPLYRYLNFHRSCFFPTIVTDEKGKQRKHYSYQQLLTPYEKLISLEDYSQYLKADVTVASLQAYADTYTDHQAASMLKKAKQNLFQRIIKQSA